MKKVLDRFNTVVDLADKANKLIKEGKFEHTTGFGPRFHKMIHYNNKRIHSLGIYDYHTKKYVIFEMVNMVGQKDNVPAEFDQMEKMILDAKIA